MGLVLVSGTGERLGVIDGVIDDRWGRPKHLSFREPGAGGASRRVPLRFVRGVAQGEVRLAGPREGYHITRVEPR